MDSAFLSFCESSGFEPTEDRQQVWLAALDSTRNQLPVAYGMFAPDGTVLGILDAIPPHLRPQPTPLYAAPVGSPHKPLMTRQQIMQLWDNYFREDTDIEGFARCIERYHRN